MPIGSERSRGDGPGRCAANAAIQLWPSDHAGCLEIARRAPDGRSSHQARRSPPEYILKLRPPMLRRSASGPASGRSTHRKARSRRPSGISRTARAISRRGSHAGGGCPAARPARARRAQPRRRRRRRNRSRADRRAAAHRREIRRPRRGHVGLGEREMSRAAPLVGEYRRRRRRRHGVAAADVASRLGSRGAAPRRDELPAAGGATAAGSLRYSSPHRQCHQWRVASRPTSRQLCRRSAGMGARNGRPAGR